MFQKRALPDIGDDTDDTNAGAKRLRLSGTGMAGGEECPTQDIPQVNTRPFQPKNRSHLTNPDDEKSTNNLVELEAGLCTMQRNMDLERATIRDIQRAEEQAKTQEEEKRAREAGMRDQNYRSALQSSLHKMWHDCDRDREAAEERRNTREREEREYMGEGCVNITKTRI
ncbi:hypothetical protein UCDDA912_g01042 [Diaporthe ampelina]|uniref:Uncharacterized protein n=1 Tax=Diaporthe ampelina TaxID=1214573 RepID=A0A0G2FXN9_9PEZI|nr:hypothetical protein UCDDA912_g01042 [Diaporthe ampelina]